MNEQKDTTPGVRVTMSAILELIHTKYTKQVASLVQENAELEAALKTVQSERDELGAKVAALTGK